MRILTLLMLLLISLETSAQDLLPLSDKRIAGFDPRRDDISEDYQAGAFLIYNCQKKHWVCVMEEFFDQCKQQREEDVFLEKTHARCAAIKGYEVKFSCFQEQLRLTSTVEPSKLCILDSWKPKYISFD